MRWNRNVHLNQASTKPVPLTGKLASVLLKEEASSREILADLSGARLTKVPHENHGVLIRTTLTFHFHLPHLTNKVSSGL